MPDVSQTPQETYRRRRDDRLQAVAAHRRAESRYSLVRLLLFLAGLALIWPTLFSRSLGWTWLLLPLACFVVTAIAHDRVIQWLSRANRGVAFYERGLARLEGRWADIGLAEGEARRGDTAVEIELLKEVGHALATPASGAALNSKIIRQLKTKGKMFETGTGLDWATGEALAFGTLLCESTPVRLSGEDVGRGTFSQRHAILYDQETEERHIPLNNIRYGQAPFECIDSPMPKTWQILARCCT